MPFSTADPAGFVGIALQAALGTGGTSAPKFRFAKYLDGTDCEPDQTIVHLREGGDGLDMGYAYKQAVKVAGQLVLNVRPDIAGVLLAACPAGATYCGGTSPATHLFHTAHASHPLVTLQMAYPATSIVRYISDARILGMTIEGAAGQPWKMTAPFTGMKWGASSTVLAATYLTEEPLKFHDNPAYALDGASDGRISGFKITVGLTAEELQAQAVTLDDIAILTRDTSIEVTRRYEGATQWLAIYSGYAGGVAPTVGVYRGSFSAQAGYGAGTALRQLTLTAPQVAWDTNVLTALSPDGKTVEETITGIIEKGATTALFANLTNVHASAYM